MNDLNDRPFSLPELPFKRTELIPYLSEETIFYHFERHHAGYVKKLNELVSGTPKEGLSLEELVRFEEGPIFQNAAQSWNHTFYWHCLSINSRPAENLSRKITELFGSFHHFEEIFKQKGANLFGSGWVWLAKDNFGNLEIISSSNAENPLRADKTPLLVCDVWEHAYYVDYQNSRSDYLKNFWKIINWQFAETNFMSRKIPNMTALMRLSTAA